MTNPELIDHILSVFYSIANEYDQAVVLVNRDDEGFSLTMRNEEDNYDDGEAGIVAATVKILEPFHDFCMMSVQIEGESDIRILDARGHHLFAILYC